MDLGKLSIDELIKKAQKYENHKEVHNRKMKKYRETHLDYAREWGRKQAQKYYWRKKGFEIAESTATLLFPAWVISDETVKKAQHWLDVTGKDASNALRRSVTEGRDAMSRAIKARAADK